MESLNNERYPTLLCCFPAINSNHLTCNIAGSIRGKEKHCGRQFTWLSNTLHGCGGGNNRLRALKDGFSHACSEHSGSNSIHTYIPCCPLYGKGAGQINHRSFTAIIANSIYLSST